MGLLEDIKVETAVFLTAREFGEEATYTDSNAVVTRMLCVFDLASEVIDIGEQASMDGVSAIAMVEEALMPIVKHAHSIEERASP